MCSLINVVCINGRAVETNESKLLIWIGMHFQEFFFYINYFKSRNVFFNQSVKYNFERKNVNVHVFIILTCTNLYILSKLKMLIWFQSLIVLILSFVLVVVYLAYLIILESLLKSMIFCDLFVTYLHNYSNSLIFSCFEFVFLRVTLYRCFLL